MTIPDEFVLAALFSEIGRLQKRAGDGQGTVSELSQKWLEARKFHNVAQALGASGDLIRRAARLALGCEPRDSHGRLDEDAGDALRPLVSLFSKIPAKNQGDVKIHYIPLQWLEDFVYPEQSSPKPSNYQQLWNEFNDKLTEIGDNLTPTAALLLLEHYTACVPFLLSDGKDPLADTVSDISLFDHLKLTAAIASCLYACQQDGINWRDEKALKYLLVGGDFSGVQDFIYRISSKGALKALRGRSFFLELLTRHVIADLLEATGLSETNVLYAGGAQFSLLLPSTGIARREIGRVREEINTYLIQVHAAKLYLVLEGQEFGDNGFHGAEDGWAKIQALLGRRIRTTKNRKFSEFLDSDDSGDEAKCSLCGALRGLVNENELKWWGLEEPLCRFCFLLVPKGPREQPKTEQTQFSDFTKECQWYKAKGNRPVLYRVGEEFVAGCMHAFCLGNMKIDECAVCHRQTLLSPLPTPDIQKFTQGESEGEKPDKPEPILACPFCRNLYHLGEHLPDLRHVVRSRNRPSGPPRILFNIGLWFYTFPLEVKDFEKSLLEQRAHGWLINERTVRRYAVRQPISPLFLGNYHPNVTEDDRKRLGMTKEQKALDFSNLAMASIGSKLIGLLRMDVDNLGELFTRRLPVDLMTPARTSALSRLLNKFFTYFIHALCDGRGLLADQERPFWLLEEGRFDCASKKRWVTVVYSGGDDLFIVGAWSEIIELAFDIHAAFSRYVCCQITLSGGMVVQQENFPLYQIADLAKDAEKAAKDNVDSQGKVKNSLAPLYGSVQKAFFWDEAEKLRELVTLMVRDLKDEIPDGNRLHLKVPRALLTQLFQIVEIYRKEGKLYLPSLHYILARKDLEDCSQLRQRLLNLDTIKYLYAALVWVELLSREEAGI